ncbi:hypothetical protein B0T18DRAFT_393842 [Schizothecium vesticola]|uniref:Uncharacterized protein n=1 Tax=Schizothecium vesticola TaxID=314040 RepID=A0AA40EKT3_9PEZI|nr:hypothetical protein B0T18DRAFT_393842 [Schizothecium vesticola]
MPLAPALIKLVLLPLSMFLPLYRPCRNQLFQVFTFLLLPLLFSPSLYYIYEYPVQHLCHGFHTIPLPPVTFAILNGSSKASGRVRLHRFTTDIREVFLRVMRET